MMRDSISVLISVRRYYAEHGLLRTVRAFIEHKDHPLAQFVKYGICGVGSVLLLSAMMAGYALVWPELLNSQVNPDPENRAFWFAVFTWISFIPVNTAVWWVNRLVIFHPGKHAVWKEYLLFTLISGISQALGLILPDWLIKNYNIPSYIALGCMIVCSTVCNFVLRKMFVFSRSEVVE